ncbi:PREDICTED: uncharacterized membrane protein At3g27390-like [Nelumbo nucifera]|uniref:Uncharacterized membrane protein At3g27390-like n=2 Tax=Nelumbo nucifera TaxID=4432 RepID=A0A1U8AM54_NELNU|nr:PREDICTED: uncharacterized membrane protein At3g27390-like [Nelumbo nucifera]DAD46880.1 TPA_asm: hypothetical protein HUJ06_016817 [Nelumbo nucifera]
MELHALVFFPVFMLLLVLGIIKAILIGPIVFLVISLGNLAVIVGLWPFHVVWTYYCVAKSKNFGGFMKGFLFQTLPIPLLLVWPLVGVIGSIFTGLGYGFFWPLMATFEVIVEGVPNKFIRCFTDGTWSSILVGCTIVRDFWDFCFYSYFSVMDGLLEQKTTEPIEIKVSQIPGCTLAGILGVLIDFPVTSFIVLYKAPVMLFKGWRRLVRDLFGRADPFLKTAWVPFDGLSIILWPVAVGLTFLAGISSSFFLGFYAAVVAYQENSIKKGILYAIAVVSLFDEYTNDFLYLREGSCFPRPRYRKGVSPTLPLLPLRRLPEKTEALRAKKSPLRTASMKVKTLKAVVIWNNFFEACENVGKELIRDGAIGLQDLEEWQLSKNKIINIGIPAYSFLLCFLRSIKNGSDGFLMRNNVELTNINRPEGRVFDWFFEPMSLMKEQIKKLNLRETEELYLQKLTLYCGDMQRLAAWENGGFPPDPEEKIREAELEEISRRLQGFCLKLSRLPTFRRRFDEVVKALVKEAKQRSSGCDSGSNIKEAV